MRSAWTWPVSVLLVACLAGCGGKSAAEYEQDAQTALDGKNPAQAVAIVDEALAKESVRQDAPAAWRLEQIRLDALARQGKGGEVKTQLERLAGTYPKQVSPSLYRSLADKTKTAGDNAGAIEILVAGGERFPDDKAAFAQAVAALKAAGGVDPAAVEKLRKLGYL